MYKIAINSMFPCLEKIVRMMQMSLYFTIKDLQLSRWFHCEFKWNKTDPAVLVFRRVSFYPLGNVVLNCRR